MNRLGSDVGIFSGEGWSWWYASRDCRGKMKKGIAGGGGGAIGIPSRIVRIDLLLVDKREIV
jgi:hypothetical protein